MKSRLTIGTSLLAFSLMATAASAQTYGPFPVTEKSYSGEVTNSVFYSGQVARSLLVEALKKLAATGNGGANAAEVEAQMMAYFKGSDADLPIISHKDKGDFVIKQTGLNEVSSGKNLIGKAYAGLMPAWPGNLTGAEVLEDMIKRAAQSDGGFDPETGMDWPQLIQKFALGAVGYNQAVDVYLDEKLAADTKPNNAPYSEGAPYTGKEHSWDEGFGYFGAAAHSAELTAEQNYNINKFKDVAAADADGDGVIDLKSEMVYGSAYYASSFDLTGKTDYLATIMAAFIDGRKLIASANGAALSDAQRAQLVVYADVIAEEWEKVLAEATFKYAGSVYKDIAALRAASEDEKADAYRKYVKHWGEMKGFSMALQAGKNNLGGTAVRLNRLIGFGPVTLDETVVSGVDAEGNFVKDRKMSWNAYQLNMLKVQDLMVKKFDVEARINDGIDDLVDLVKELDSDGGGAETD